MFQKSHIFANKSYMRNFVIRGLLLAAMEAAGVRKLSGAGDISATAFAAAFPDQRSWIRRMCARPGVSLAQLVASLEYRGRVELLTMVTCLLLNPRMRFSPQWFADHRRILCRHMVQQHREHGVYRLPELCVKDVT